MANLLFILVALVLFTIGFRLVKMGNPYRRAGGDTYTKRRKFRMLGWMMWATAGVLAFLTLVHEILTYPPPIDLAHSNQTFSHPDAAPIPTRKFAVQFIPNLISTPSLQINSPGMVGATNSVDLSFMSVPSVQHKRSTIPSLVTPLSDDTATIPGGAGRGRRGADGPLPSTVIGPDPTGMQSIKAADMKIAKDPKNVVGYIERANVYLGLRKLDLAKADFERALRIKKTSAAASFGLAEIAFVQGQYDVARPGFVAIESDLNYGDLAKYKVFLCDLFGGHEDAATHELAVFNDEGSEASYYFANMAWSYYHKKPDDAQNWWQSAVQIFSPAKVQIYARSLIDLGYLKVPS